jgi:hypothetical protein
VLIDAKQSGSLLDATSYRGADAASDHSVVVSTVRSRISNAFYRQDQAGRSKPAVMKQYKDKIRVKFRSMEIENGENKGIWTGCKKALTEVANDSLQPDDIRERKYAVEQDLHTLGIRGRENIALDRSRWQGTVKAGKACNKVFKKKWLLCQDIQQKGQT